MKKGRRIFLKFFFILIVSMAGAGIFNIWLLPKLVENPKFADSQFVKAFKKELRVYPKEEFYIQENIALEGAIERVENAVIGIKTELKNKKIFGSGLILTSDGLAITLNSLIDSKSEIYYQEETVSFEVLKGDEKNNLALLKLEKSNLPTVGFADLEKLKLGRRIFLTGKLVVNGEIKTLANQGIVKSIDKNFLETNILENPILSGAPVFDISANALGICFIEENQVLKIIPISIIKNFTGL